MNRGRSKIIWSVQKFCAVSSDVSMYCQRLIQILNIMEYYLTKPQNVKVRNRLYKIYLRYFIKSIKYCQV